MKYNLTDSQSYDADFLEQFSYFTKGESIIFNQDLTADDIIAIESHFNEMTKAGREVLIKEEKRKADITAKATAHIESQYSPLSQRKLMSVAVALLDKQIQGGTLISEELAALQNVRDINAQITNIRALENTAINNNTPVDEVVF